MEKTLEYQRTVDPPAEVVLTELATQYEALIDQAMGLSDLAADASTVSKKGGVAGASSTSAATSKQLKLKD